jgi:hypothetical protein
MLLGKRRYTLKSFWAGGTTKERWQRVTKAPVSMKWDPEEAAKVVAML